MSTHKWIDRICIIAVVVALLLTILFMNGEALGLQAISSIGYEDRLFDDSRVHTVDIVMDDWENFIETCENEQYASCTVVIDGEAFSNVGIRAKGNTSLSSVSSMGSQRYSFKIEFDQYDNSKSYYGLDKISLNNLIQDNTMMKDYLVYQMMGEMGVASPLCSYVYITVNGEEWGLYLAVEAVEESFLLRNYGADYGELYKPDSMNIANGGEEPGDAGSTGGENNNGSTGGEEDAGSMGGETDETMPGDGNSSGGGESSEGGETNPTAPSDAGSAGGEPSQEGSAGGEPGEAGSGGGEAEGESGFGGEPTEGGSGGGEEFGGFGMGNSDVKLQYIDDDPASYSNIFGSAKTDVTEADQERLIAALKNLNSGIDLENTVDMDAVIAYFVVHNFVCNGDSYTGSIIHNYYLYEENGMLAMIPWDYNLAFGSFQAGDASGAVNASIDSPVSGGSVADRPMLGWIFEDEVYTEQYHQVFRGFMEQYFDSGVLEQKIRDTVAMIEPYVQKDPTKFCTAEEFQSGVETMKQFLSLRAESVLRQLSGDETPVDTGSLNLADMGAMGGGFDSPEGDDGGSSGGGEPENGDVDIDEENAFPGEPLPEDSSEGE